jgi:hypothetical protein
MARLGFPMNANDYTSTETEIEKQRLVGRSIRGRKRSALSASPLHSANPRVIY